MNGFTQFGGCWSATFSAIAMACCAALACSAPLQTVKPKRVVLVTIDTLRADHLGCYGNQNARTPVLDKLASEGVLFLAAFSPTPLTLPSHASLMTGLDPPAHGVRNNATFALPDSLPTLAEGMRDAGYATGAVIAAMVLDRQYGLARGFDHYDDELGLQAAGGLRMRGFPERSGGRVTKAALDWIETAPEMFFLWVHYYDPHFPYEAPFWDLAPNQFVRYADEIRVSDAALGRLLEGIEKKWPGDETLVVVTSDHGESLGQHSESSHGLAIYDSTQRIPMIFKGAGLPKGVVVSSQVRLIDVAPSVLAMAGAAPLGDAKGRDLLPLIAGEEEGERPVYLETLATQLEFGWSPLLGLRSGQFKYVRAPRPELYDLRADPQEANDLAQLRVERVNAMDRELESHLGTWIDAQHMRGSIGEEERRLLESLGYLATTSSIPDRELGVVGGADPKDKVEVREKIRQVTLAFEAGEPQKALFLLDEVAGEESPVIALWGAQSALWVGDAKRSERYARRAIELAPLRFDGHSMLGKALLKQGRLDDARVAFEATVRLAPEMPAAWLGLGEVMELSNDLEAAAGFYQRAMRSRAGGLEGVVRLAALHFAAGRPDQARPILEPIGPRDLNQPAWAERLARAEAKGGLHDAALERLNVALREAPHSLLLLRARDELGEPAGGR